MAALSFATGDPQVVKVWGKGVEREALPQTIGRLIFGKQMGAPVREFFDLVKGAGDRYRVSYNSLLDGPSIKHPTSIDGSEEAPEYLTDDVVLNAESQGVRFEAVMTDQQTEYKYREDARMNLGRWWAEWHTKSSLNQLAGYLPANQGSGFTSSNGTGADGNNTITAPTALSHFVVNGLALELESSTGEHSLTSADVFSSAAIDGLVLEAETRRNVRGLPIIQKAKFPVSRQLGYGLIISPAQYDSLRQETSSNNPIGFGVVNLADHQGGDQNTVIRTRYENATSAYVGMYNTVHIFVSPYIPPGLDSSDQDDAAGTHRAIFFGPQAGWCVYGKKTPGMTKFDWREEEFRYGEEYGIAARLLWGTKKSVIDSEDLAVLVATSGEDV